MMRTHFEETCLQLKKKILGPNSCVPEWKGHASRKRHYKARVREMETKLQCPRPQNSPDTIGERTRLAQSNVHPREAGQQPYCSLIL